MSNKKRKSGNFSFNFGQYKGRLLKEIKDAEYLKWCLANLDLVIYLREAIKLQIRRCEKEEKKKNPNFKKFFISF
jgi:hypothetical protein